MVREWIPQGKLTTVKDSKTDVKDGHKNTHHIITVFELVFKSGMPIFSLQNSKFKRERNYLNNAIGPTLDENPDSYLYIGGQHNLYFILSSLKESYQRHPKTIHQIIPSLTSKSLFKEHVSNLRQLNPNEACGSALVSYRQEFLKSWRRPLHLGYVSYLKYCRDSF